MRNGQTLRNLLRVLIQEWGAEEVQKSLSFLLKETDQLLDIRASKASQRQKKPKPSPTELVEKSDFDQARKVLLKQIAEKYETREFLPSPSDVREFIFLLGDRPNEMKDRKDAFRSLLKSLGKLTTERLKHIEHNAQHSGPSQLGPLSDAISGMGAALQRNRADDDAARSGEDQQSVSTTKESNG